MYWIIISCLYYLTDYLNWKFAVMFKYESSIILIELKIPEALSFMTNKRQELSEIILRNFVGKLPMSVGNYKIHWSLIAHVNKLF